MRADAAINIFVHVSWLVHVTFDSMSSHTPNPLNNGRSIVCINCLPLVWLGNTYDGATWVEPGGLWCPHGDEGNAALASMQNPLNGQIGAECPHLPCVRETQGCVFGGKFCFFCFCLSCSFLLQQHRSTAPFYLCLSTPLSSGVTSKSRGIMAGVQFSPG